MNWTDVESILLVQRLRRNFSRNSDILELCAMAEWWIAEAKAAKPKEPIKVTGAEPDRLRAPRGTFDRKNYKRIYQREWLRRKRARDGLGTGGE